MATKENFINPTGYKQRTYNVDDFFFNTPNELNSYYAGFIAADGHICSRNSEKRTLKIGLSSKTIFPIMNLNYQRHSMIKRNILNIVLSRKIINIRRRIRH